MYTTYFFYLCKGRNLIALVSKFKPLQVKHRYAHRTRKQNINGRKQGLKYRLLKATGLCPNFKFDSFCVGVIGTVGYEAKANNKEDELVVSRGLSPLPTWLLVPLYPQSSIFVFSCAWSHYASWDATGASGESSLPSFVHLSFFRLKSPPTHLMHFVAVGTEECFFAMIIRGEALQRQFPNPRRAGLKVGTGVAGGKRRCQFSSQCREIACTAVKLLRSGQRPCLGRRRAVLSF